MGITSTAASRDAELRPSSNPERNESLQRSPFLHGSIVAQLENDRFNDDECASTGPREPVDAAWGRGWNAASRHAEGLVRGELGLRELRHAHVIRTVELEHAAIDLRLKHALIGGDE